jgi:hypothetical protein
MSDPAREKTLDSLIPRTTTNFAVPRAVFDSVPARRATYIIAYALYIVLVYGPNVLALAGVPPNELLGQVLFVLYGAGIAGYLVFAYQFIRTARIMGFEYWIAVGSGVIALSAFPGPLLVAYMDRKIATAWDAADPAGGYRQRPPIPKDHSPS